MREIKFRAWDKEEKIMVPIEPFIVAYKPKWIRENIVLMQYTGLKDKNNKEIYEGDVIHFLRRVTDGFDMDVERIFIIEWRDGGFWGKNSQIKIRDIAGGYSEIIGNIYGNPELLK